MSGWADRDIAPRVKRIPGVGDCQFDGNKNREMRITFDPERLKARRLTIEDVKRFIDRTNLNQSGGYFVEGTAGMDSANGRRASERRRVPKSADFQAGSLNPVSI